MTELTNAERLALQAHARRGLAGVGLGARTGECSWHTAHPHWGRSDLHFLRARGLIVVRGTSSARFVRVTDAGYEALRGSGSIVYIPDLEEEQT